MAVQHKSDFMQKACSHIWVAIWEEKVVGDEVLRAWLMLIIGRRGFCASLCKGEIGEARRRDWRMDAVRRGR